MKKALLVILNSLFIILNSFAQNVPQKFNYQGVARLANGDLVVNTTIRVQFSLIPDASGNNADYVEWHETTTNAFGLFTLQIGGGTVVTGTTISDLEWGTIRYIKIGLDPDGTTNGLNYLDMGTSQLLTVPYAKLAENTINKEWTTVTDGRVILRPAAPFHTVAIGDSVGTGDQSLLVTGTIDDDETVFITNPGEGTGIYSFSQEGLAGEFYGMYGMRSTGIIGAGYFSSQDSSSAPTLSVEKSFSQTSSEGNGIEVGMNSGGLSNHIMLHEFEQGDYARISFTSTGLGYGTTSDVWTLAGKTDAQTNANSRFHIYRNGIGNVLSATGTGNVGIGISDPTSKLEVAGQVKITGGSPGNGKVLTSDANGLASWQTISGTGFVLPFDQTYNNNNTTAFIVRNNDGNAISGISLDGTGVLGQSSTNYGVDGFSSSNVGISGRSQTGTGGRFISQSGPALVTAGGNVGLGTSSPSAQLEVAGQVKITGGSPGNGKVLTSDANGLATWQTPSGSGGLTLPYLGTYQSGFGNVVFEVRNISPASGPIVIKGTNISYSGVSSGGGTGVSGYDDSNNTGQGVSGFSTLGIGGFFSTNSGKALVAQGPVAIIDGTQGLGKVLTSDANGLATWQTPSGGGGGGQWSNTTGGIYNTDLTNVGIGTSLPYAKLHVEGGQVFFTGNINDVLRVTGTGTDLSAVGIQALNGTGLNTNAKIGIDAQGSVTGVKAVTIATSGGAGLTAESYSGTGAAVEAYNSVYSGPALKIINGGVVDVGGKWSYRATVNSGDPTVVWLNYPNPLSTDMIYLQPVGTGNGALNHLLEWDSVNSNWKILPATGTFDVNLSFNVMIIHAN